MSYKTIRSLILGVAILIVAAPPVPASQKDTLIIGMSQFPASFHPNFEAMTAKYYALNFTMRPFTAYDKDWNLVCMLCTQLPTMENGGARLTDLGDGKQGIAVTFTIQPDATWGDGTPVTTRDVEHTIEVGKNPATGVLGAEFYRRVLSVEVADDKTFTLHMDRIDYKYNALDLYLVPEHIDRAVYAAPAEYRNRNIYDNDTYNPGLYFGPYRISKVEPGAYIELVRNDTWYGKAPHFSKIIIRIIENTAALEANLLSGSVDYISGRLGVTLDQALAIQKRHPDDFDFIFRPGLIYEHIDLNLDNPILADHRIRMALIYAIDRQAISQQLFGGQQPVADSFVSPLDSIYNQDIKKYAYDPEQASQLLSEAGWVKAAPSEGDRAWTESDEGPRHNSDGEPLLLEFGTTSGSRVREAVQQILQIQWKQVGIDVRVRNEPARVFFGETVAKRQYPGLAMYAWVSDPESSPRTTLHSTEIPTEENSWVGTNFPGYRNPEVDRLIDEVEVTLDREKRLMLFAQIQNHYIADLPVIPLYYRSSSFIIPKWLNGMEPTGNTSTTTLWAEYWSVNQ
ncbi:MAG: peptide ABC transporter substrate-binding protein [Acidiferrobacterales bacterium]|nr:peptide ABC transporter substrate-binding protein [Acidiferrobacterales bacterium]